jgi:hypothetical protein
LLRGEQRGISKDGPSNRTISTVNRKSLKKVVMGRFLIRREGVKMRKTIAFLVLLVMTTSLVSCATANHQRYNTQRGAAVGAGVGALAGQAIGRNTESTLIGAAVGTLLGAIVGNAQDQTHAAAREAAATNKRVVYYDDQGGALEAVPGPVNQRTNCRKVTKRHWEKGQLMSETVEEVCEGQKNTRDY